MRAIRFAPAVFLALLAAAAASAAGRQERSAAQVDLCSPPAPGTPVKKSQVPDDSRFLDQQYALTGSDHDYAKDFASFQEAAAKGNVDAQLNVGIAYVRGVGTRKDVKEGMRWLRTAAEGGQPRASHYLASIYIAGEDVPLDYAAAYYWLLISGAAGHENHNEDVLKAMLSASQVEAERQRATEWFRTHASVPAYAYQLAVDYDTGRTISENPPEFFKWLRQAAEDGHSFAQYQLGFAYLRTELKVDRSEALKWLRLAALQGEPRAQLALGKTCTEKPAPDGNLAGGKAWMKLATTSGQAYVMNRAALYYITDNPELRDLDEAVMLAERAVAETHEQNADYLSTLGTAYFVSEQTEEAMKVGRQFVALRPNDPELNNRLAWWELTAKDEKFRNPVHALQLAKNAVAQSQEKEPAYLDTLAEAYYANGDPQKAVELERKAIALNPSDIETFRQNLDKYAHAQQQKN